MDGRFRVLHLPTRLESGNWRPVLRRWGQLLDDYSWVFAGGRDHAFWHTERSLTGLFATAAWSVPRGWALEEFSTDRRAGRSSRAGRGDLMFGTNHRHFTVEAKIAWLNTNVAGADAKVTKKLSAAKKQLCSLDRAYCSGRLVALCYAVPYLTKAAVRRGLVEVVMEDLPARFAHSPYGVAVYQPSGRLPALGDRVFPGVIVIAKPL